MNSISLHSSRFVAPAPDCLVLIANFVLLLLLDYSSIALGSIAGHCKVDHLREFLHIPSTRPLPSNGLFDHSKSASGPSSASGGGRRGELYIYAITQDCQLVFARWDQLAQFNELVEVDTRLNYCLPGLVQLHWRTFWYNSDGEGSSSRGGGDGEGEGRLGFQLLFKRTNNQVCTLPVEFPEENALSGQSLFSYSLRSSLPYSSCSYTRSVRNNNNNGSSPEEVFVLEPELSFMDSIYSDVIYFLNPQSSGPYWGVKQFKIDGRGYLRHMENFIVKNFAAASEEDSSYDDKDKFLKLEPTNQRVEQREREFYMKIRKDSSLNEKAYEHLLALDLGRRRLYAVHRRKKLASVTCAFDLLFRPHKMMVERCSLLAVDKVGGEVGRMNQFNSDHRINSITVDGPLILFTELNRRGSESFSTTLLIAHRERNDSARCLLELPYIAKFGLIRGVTLAELREIQLPTFKSAVVGQKLRSRPAPTTHTAKTTFGTRPATTRITPTATVIASPVTTTRRWKPLWTTSRMKNTSPPSEGDLLLPENHDYTSSTSPPFPNIPVEKTVSADSTDSNTALKRHFTAFSTLLLPSSLLTLCLSFMGLFG